MDVAQNKANTRRIFVEGFSQGRVDIVDDLIAPHAKDGNVDLTDKDLRTHLKWVIGMLRDSCPDLQARVDHLVGEGNRVAAHVTLSGTHTGAPLLGSAASGRSFEVEQFHLVELDGEGRCVHHWANLSDQAMLRQLGVEPAAAAH